MKPVKFIFFLFLAWSSGCAAYGGGTIGTGLPTGSAMGEGAAFGGNIESSHEARVTPLISVSGSLVNDVGGPAGGVALRIDTLFGTQTVTTDRNGRFIAELRVEDGELVSISLKENKSSHGASWTFRASQELQLRLVQGRRLEVIKNE